MVQYLILTANMLPKDSDSKPRSRMQVMKTNETASWLSLLQLILMLETSWRQKHSRRIRNSTISWLAGVPAETRILSKSASKSRASCKNVSRGH